MSEGAGDHTRGGSHAAEDDGHQHERRPQEVEARRGDRRLVRREQHTRDAAEDRAGDVGRELHLVGVDAHRLGGVLVLADEPPRPAQPAAFRAGWRTAPR